MTVVYIKAIAGFVLFLISLPLIFKMDKMKCQQTASQNNNTHNTRQSHFY